MKPIPSDVCANDPVMHDKFGCDQIEQLVVNVFAKLVSVNYNCIYLYHTNPDQTNLDVQEQYVGTTAVIETDEEVFQEDTKDEDIRTEDGIELLKASFAEGLDGIVLSRVRGLLYDDADIYDSAKHFQLDPDVRFSTMDGNIAEFLIEPERFQVWRERHQQAISTKFVCSRNYKYPVPDQHRLTFMCQCAGQKGVRKDAVRGGKSGKPRIRKEGIKKGCLSRIHALFKPIPMADGSSKPGCIVEYHYQHNHAIGDMTDLGAGQKPTAMMAIIERSINQGSTIRRVMQQITMKRDKFTQITRGKGLQLSRSDSVTFDDIYDIWLRITTAVKPEPVVLHDELPNTAVAEAVLKAVPETVSEAVPVPVPETVPEAVPEGAPEDVPETDALDIQFQRLWRLNELRDRKAHYPLGSQVLIKTQELIDLLESSVPVLQVQVATMSGNPLTLFCLVDGDATSNAFPVKSSYSGTVYDPKDAIKSALFPQLEDIAANKLTLWRVSIPNFMLGTTISLNNLEDKTGLTNPRTRLSVLFLESPDDNIYILVQRPSLAETSSTSAASP
ncbi:hypothetical protein BG004_003690 [Podila humilis]|nr:hypothetical protein BG004_003690 [Podila humilis]